MARTWTRVHEEFADGSGYEHVNPDAFLTVAISGIVNGNVEVTLVERGTKDEVCYEFKDEREARRFINRLGLIDNE